MFADTIAKMANTIADRERLIADDGTLFCWGCGVEGASFPTLHCPDCLARAKARREAATRWFTKHGIRYEGDPESTTAHRWRCMKRNMRDEKRLDRESAFRLLMNARQLPGAFEGDIAELSALFDRRFGKEPTVKRKHAVAYAEEST